MVLHKLNDQMLRTITILNHSSLFSHYQFCNHIDKIRDNNCLR